MDLKDRENLCRKVEQKWARLAEESREMQGSGEGMILSAEMYREVLLVDKSQILCS